MTPYEIDILLWYYARCEDHPDKVRNPPVWKPTIDGFLDANLLHIAVDPDCLYALTERGGVYVQALMRVPLPEPAWEVTWPESFTKRDNERFKIPKESDAVRLSMGEPGLSTRAAESSSSSSESLDSMLTGRA
jgi:hypothetical protein